MARACAMRSAMGAGPCDFNGLPGLPTTKPDPTQNDAKHVWSAQHGLHVRDQRTPKQPNHLITHQTAHAYTLRLFIALSDISHPDPCKQPHR